MWHRMRHTGTSRHYLTLLNFTKLWNYYAIALNEFVKDVIVDRQIDNSTPFKFCFTNFNSFVLFQFKI